MLHQMLQNMFQLPIPILEKILRPILVYFALIALLRVFGKRELAQLNPFDLVVLLSLSNTVQNAIIGNDNSLSGGLIGAATLLTVNWLLARLIYGSERANHAIAGTDRILILDGMVDHAALKKELMTEEELLGVVRRQGYEDFAEVAKCVLEPNGSFYISAIKPSFEDNRQQVLLNRLDLLSGEVQALRTELAKRA
jgi:uncharacterized membrane protein YcaP (DUF421 family)